jgi:hypothetical protein
MTRPQAVFVTARHSSSGETFTASRFAADLAADGWAIDFLAFPYAARYLQQQGWSLTLLGESREENHRTLQHLMAERSPQLIITSDLYLLESADVARLWSNRWLFTFGCPVVTFDHLAFHPQSWSFKLLFLRRFKLRTTAGDQFGEGEPFDPHGRFPKGEAPVSDICEVDELPIEVAGVVRPCPIHDPGPDSDLRIKKYCAIKANGGNSPGQARDRLGLDPDERLILVPVGSWALQLAIDLSIPYYDYYPRLLARYLRRCPVKVRIVMLCSELKPSRESHGRVTIQSVPGLPFDQTTSLIAASDLLLCDNITSATIGRAVMIGGPAAVATSKVEAHHEAGSIRFTAPFSLSNHVAHILDEMERRAPGSVFPFSVYPLGWTDATRRLLAGNPYTTTFTQLELFDEKQMMTGLEQLLLDQEVRQQLMQRQTEYREAALGLPVAAEIASQILAAKQSSQPWGIS